jgi:hypothetical protein
MFSPRKRVYRSDETEGFSHWEFEDGGYHFVTNRDLFGNERDYQFKPFFHETARHGILVFEIARYLRNYTRKIKTYLSRKPDIVFLINGKEWAVEIETGIILKKNKQQLLYKVQSLRENYGRRWFFVITDRNLLNSYKRYGKTYTRRNIIRKIDNIMNENGIEFNSKNLPSEREYNWD